MSWVNVVEALIYTSGVCFCWWVFFGRAEKGTNGKD